MVWIAAIGGIAFSLASLLVGGRLLWMARSTRGLPELVLGVGLFTMGGIGAPMISVAKAGTDLSDAVRAGLLAGYLVLATASSVMMLVFTWRVFRPGPGAGRAVAILVSLIAVAGPASIPFLSSVAEVLADRGGSAMLLNLSSILVYSWGAFEALRYASAMRKRARLGLADPLVANRIHLWGIAMAMACGMASTNMIGAVSGTPAVTTPIGALSIGVTGFLMACCIGLAFVPTQAYVSWLRRTAS